MKKSTLILSLILQWCLSVYGQGEENLWTFGHKAGLDFTSTSPVVYANNLLLAYEGSASICDAGGSMLFYTSGFWVWNRDHELMPELTGGVGGYTAPIATVVGYPPLMPWTGGYATQATAIAGMPAHPGKYYLFSLGTNGQLFYSVIDMSLNSGKGGIESGKKGVILATGLAEKLTVVKGCNNIWVVARSRTANQYKAFELNDTGMVTTPVISNCGNLPVSWYRGGTIKFSPDGSKMAAACNAANNNKGGLELYDFDQKTGTLSSPLVLDSSSTLGYYYGTCFSPDNSKLYASVSSFSHAGSFYYGKVRQFDLSLGTAAAIIASNTVVFTDASYEPDKLGDLKRGKDDQIYFSSGLPSVSTMHSITSPNLAGSLCNAVANVVTLPSGSASRGIPNDIALIPLPDTIRSTQKATVCFRDQAILSADTGKRYMWDNGTTTKERTVTANGTYVVRYVNTDCKIAIDSFIVRFIPLPVISPSSYSCPGIKQGKASVTPQPGNATLFQYSWRDGLGNLLQEHWSNTGDTLTGLDTGMHYVQITTPTGCDTTIVVTIIALPVPQASFTADSIACKDVPVAFINTSTALLWKWFFGDGNYSDEQNASYAYGHRGTYKVALVVTNIEGCTDTAYEDIEVKGLDLRLTKDKDLVNRGELIHLQSSGSESYTVTGWEPYFLFPNQSAISQIVAMDTTRTFIVTGISEFGCIDSASVEVAVNPIVFMPNVFSPNGDGLNDRFRPVSTGYIFVRYFEIYNRWGQQVYHATGTAAQEGWNGLFNGQPAETGTYYYHINIETKDNNTIALKGDVILLR